MDNIYSEWFKVDLHIHTNLSNQTKPNDYDGTFDIKVLKEKLVDNDVKLFSLTDHNIINVEAYRDYYASFTIKDPVLLIGCEFDIRVNQDSGGFLTYHTLLIFNENSSVKAFELSEIIEQHFSKKNISKKERSLTEDDVFDLFCKYHFFYIPHAGGHKNIVDAYRGADLKKAQEMVLLMECAHEKVKEKHRRKHQEEFDKLKHVDFRERQNEAFINFSDNHNCSSYPIPKNGIEHEFYCLKGEPTFETIRFAFIDPESRIKKQIDVDRLKNVKKHISEIKITGIEKVNDSTIKLSPNLNVIIGGASSGKSLLFNLIGSKIENSKNDFSKYKKNNSEVLIKSSNSQIFQKSLPFDSDEVVYINQGDIVKFFEHGQLKELVTESGKEREYLQSKESLQQKKKALLADLEIFKNKFDRLNAAYYKDFSIHEGDFDNMLNDKYHFTEIILNITAIDFEERDTLLNDLTNNIIQFNSDEVFELSIDENQIVKEFEQLVNNKQNLIANKKALQESIQNFTYQIHKIIEEKNNSLESSSRAKKEAFKRKKNLINSCQSLFKDAVDFNDSCNILEKYNYEAREEISINDTVTLILETVNLQPLKKYINKCINNSDANDLVYDSYLTLVRNNNNLKDYSKYSDQNLNQKLRKETENIQGQFDTPNTFLDYGILGNSKDKSPGYNAEMYLKTILQSENCKLVMIDQPEDNLGNTFKNEDLIDLLRKYKFSKQFILVTHNPSIVVYGDAESIVLSENNKGQISYSQLVLEKKESQNTIINNLDGGKAIFDMRSRKYNIKKLLNS